MLTTLDGRLLRRQTERIPTEWMENVFAIHHLIMRNGIADDIVSEVPHVNVARGIGIHHQDVVLVFWVLWGMKEFLLFPLLLPLFVNAGKIVAVSCLCRCLAL